MDHHELMLLTEAAADNEHIGKSARIYRELRQSLAWASPASDEHFKKRFSRYYEINAAGLSANWKENYFQLLFSFREKMPNEPHQVALTKLLPIERIKGDKALQFSFVSKLVAIHDEQQPIFDRFVSFYFGLGPPSLMALPEFRIMGFLQNLAEIRRRYQAWSKDEMFTEILRDLRSKIPDLADCHEVRICDFLVWSVGKKYSRRAVA